MPETVAGIVPYESSLAEHGLKFPEARGRMITDRLGVIQENTIG